MLDFARLVRLPNAFTAMADICLGALVTGALPERLVPFIFLLMASTCLYCAGMVWNDFFDLEQDKRERPFRPIPSGRVTRRQAALFGAGLLAAGVLWAALAGAALVGLGDAGAVWREFGLALALVAAILL